MSANMEKSAVATGLKSISFHSNPKEGQCQRMFKLPHNCTHFTCYQSNGKILQVVFYSTRTKNFQMFKLDLEKAETVTKLTSDQIANICGTIEKAKEFQKNIYFCLKSLCGSQQTMGKKIFLVN